MFEPADVLDGLNDDQRRAATYLSPGRCWCWPGWVPGKTRTLVARAAWLRSQGTPASWMPLTFTRRAADDRRPGYTARRERRRPGRRRDLPRARPSDHPGARRVVPPPEFSVIDPPDVTNLMAHTACRERPGHQPAAGPAGGHLRGPRQHLVREHPRPGARGDQGPVPVGGRLRDRVGRPGPAPTPRTNASTAGVDFDDLLLLWRRWPTRPRARCCADV